MPAESTPYSLRPATRGDLSFLSELVRATMREHVEATWGAWDEDWQHDRFAERFTPERWQIIMVGVAPAGGVATEAHSDALLLANLHLLPEYQGRGIGTAIMQVLQTDAAAQGLPLTLNVLRSNHGARRLYGRLGFRVIREEKERWWMEWAVAPFHAAFHWSGSDATFLDTPSVTECGPAVVGRYGGATASGARKNEDAALIWAAPDGAWTFAALLDAHGSSESANLVLERVAGLETEFVTLLEEADSRGNSASLWELTARVTHHFADDAFRRACAAMRGETAVLLVAQTGSYLWWLSVGDIPVYVFHPDFVRLGQFALNQRMFFEWVGQVNTFALPTPCYATGVRQLRPGNSRILLTTDGLLECGTRPFENPAILCDHFAADTTSTRSVADEVREALERVHAEQGRDSATVIAWEVYLPESEETMQPSA